MDKTVDTAEISNSTSVVTQSVAGNDAAIGYISLGSLDDSVKVLTVEGVEATSENVVSGDYKIQRPFVYVVGSEVSETAQAFIDFAMSDEGQKIVEENDFIPVN